MKQARYCHVQSHHLMVKIYGKFIALENQKIPRRACPRAPRCFLHLPRSTVPPNVYFVPMPLYTVGPEFPHFEIHFTLLSDERPLLKTLNLFYESISAVHQPPHDRRLLVGWTPVQIMLIPNVSQQQTHACIACLYFLTESNLFSIRFAQQFCWRCSCCRMPSLVLQCRIVPGNPQGAETQRQFGNDMEQPWPFCVLDKAHDGIAGC